MINHVLIAYNDNLDEECRRFFQDCADEARSLANKPYTFIAGEELTADKIQEKVNEIETGFIFFAASHGDNNCLYNAQYQEILSENVNEYLFNENIVYTIACLCGNNLGEILVRNGVKSFWGYKSEFVFSIDQPLYIVSAVEAYLHLLQGEDDETCYNKALQKYDELIAASFESDFLLASQLLSNRNGLIYHN